MDEKHQERETHCSPQRVNTRILEELREKGQMNNVIAFRMQQELHRILTNPHYHAMRKSIRGRLRRMQGLAFDGYYPTNNDRHALLNEIDNMRHPRDTKKVYDVITESLVEMEEFIEKNEAHWKATGYAGDQLRMHQDLDAIIAFAEYFRGRILFFGSARKNIGTADYDAARWLSQTIIEHTADESGHTEGVLTGAGPGIMRAANEGAMLARFNLLKKYGGLNGSNRHHENHERIIKNIRAAFISIGLRIELPFEAGWNEYLQTNLTIKAFPNRKFGMNMSASGRCVTDKKETHVQHGNRPAIFSFTPGFGTEDENWEALCAMQCGKMTPVPFIPIGKAASEMLTKTLDTMKDNATIDPQDTELVNCCPNEVEALKAYLECYEIEPSGALKNVIKKRIPTLS